MAERRVCEADALREGRAHTAGASAQTTHPVSVSKSDWHYYYPGVSVLHRQVPKLQRCPQKIRSAQLTRRREANPKNKLLQELSRTDEQPLVLPRGIRSLTPVTGWWLSARVPEHSQHPRQPPPRGWAPAKARARLDGWPDCSTIANVTSCQPLSGGGVSGGWRQPVACQSSPSGLGATDLWRLAAPGYRAMEEPVAPNVNIPDFNLSRGRRARWSTRV